jgi:hypothetical protein
MNNDNHIQSFAVAPEHPMAVGLVGVGLGSLGYREGPASTGFPIQANYTYGSVDNSSYIHDANPPVVAINAMGNAAAAGYDVAGTILSNHRS